MRKKTPKPKARTAAPMDWARIWKTRKGPVYFRNTRSNENLSIMVRCSQEQHFINVPAGACFCLTSHVTHEEAAQDRGFNLRRLYDAGCIALITKKAFKEWELAEKDRPADGPAERERAFNAPVPLDLPATWAQIDSSFIITKSISGEFIAIFEKCPLCPVPKSLQAPPGSELYGKVTCQGHRLDGGSFHKEMRLQVRSALSETFVGRLLDSQDEKDLEDWVSAGAKLLQKLGVSPEKKETE